jgi:hypothetical protein
LEREATDDDAVGEVNAVETAEGGDDEVVMEASREVVDNTAATENEAEAGDGNADEPAVLPQPKPDEEQTVQKSNAPYSTVASAESGNLIPGWVEEWDPVSNRTYYWNRDTNATSWTKPVLQTDVISQFNAMLHQNNADRKSQLRQRDELQQRQNSVAASAVSHINNVPCLYRIINLTGAPVFERHEPNPKRVISQGKIIVCTSVEYWAEIGAFMFRIPDGYINSVEVEKFLELDLPSAVSASEVNVY